MKLLAITTSTSRSGIALLDDGRLVCARTNDDDRLHAERLFPLIDEALAAAGWHKRDLAAVACDVGPGSFTGVRVGLASTKGIALGLGLPIAGVGSLAAMAAAAFAVSDAELVAALIDARRGERFIAIHERAAVRLAGAHVPAAEVPAFLDAYGPSLRVCGRAARDLIDPARVIDDPSAELPAAEWIARLAEPRFAGAGPDDLAALEPVYLRGPDAKLPARAPDWRRAPGR